MNFKWILLLFVFFPSFSFAAEDCQSYLHNSQSPQKSTIKNFFGLERELPRLEDANLELQHFMLLVLLKSQRGGMLAVSEFLIQASDKLNASISTVNRLIISLADNNLIESNQIPGIRDGRKKQLEITAEGSGFLIQFNEVLAQKKLKTNDILKFFKAKKVLRQAGFLNDPRALLSMKLAIETSPRIHNMQTYILFALADDLGILLSKAQRVYTEMVESGFVQQSISEDDKRYKISSITPKTSEYIAIIDSFFD